MEHYTHNAPFLLYTMSQVIKLQSGGKVTPKNLQEYNNQKAKLEEERRKKELEAESNSITINGKKYTRSEAKEKLGTWRGGQSAIDLRQSYGRRGKNVDSDYKKFLDMIDRGDIQSVDFNSDGGFDVKYTTQAGETFNPSDKYSSDYLTNAIRSNLLNLSTPNIDVGTPTKINLDYNPQNMLLNTIWGGKLRQDTYNNMTERERTNDVIKTLRANRNKFAEYFTDNSAFNLSGELPFKSLEEYDQFINDLESLDDDLYKKDASGNYELDTNGNKIFDKNKSTWSFAEQLRNRNFGGFWADYIFGAQNSQTQDNRIPPIQTKEQQEEVLRSELGLPKEVPLSLTLGNNIYIPSKEGLRDANTGELYTGYLWTDPYGRQDSYYKQGYYNKGIYVGGYNEAKALSDRDSNFRSVFLNAINEANEAYEKNPLEIYNPGYTGTDKFHFINRIYPGTIPENFKGRTEDITAYIDDPKLRSQMSIFNIYDESDESRPGGLYRAAKHTFKLDNEGNLVKGVLSYDDRGFQVFTDDKGNRTIIKSGPSKQSYYVDPKQIQRFINTWNRKNNNIQNANDVYVQQNKEKEQDGVPEIYRRYRLPYIPQKKLSGGILKLQEGGNIYQGSSVASKSSASMKDVTEGDWSNLSAADKADLVALGLDIAGLVSTAAVGVGNAVGAASGLGSSLATIYANAERGDMSVGEQVGAGALNLAMDAATLVPGLGTWAKGAKTVRTIKRLAPVLRTAFIGLGLGQAANAVLKATSDQEMTIDDWRQLASGLTALTSAGRQAYAKNKYTQKTLGKSKPLTVSSDKNNYNVTLSESEIGKFNGLDNNAKIQFLRDKIKTNNPNITSEELNSINLNRKELLSPKTWLGTKAKLDKSTITRELKPEVLENLSKNKYNWYEKGLIEERSFLKPQETTALNEKYIKLSPNTYGTVETSTNAIGRSKLGKGNVIEALPESRQLNVATLPDGVGELQYKSVKDVAPVKQGKSESPYFSEAESLGRYQTMAEANKQKAKKAAKTINNISEADRKKEIRARAIKKGKQEAEKRKAEKAEIERKNVEETARLGAKLQRERARQREYQDIVNYNKQQREAAQKAVREETLKKEERKTRQASKKEDKGTKKTSKDLGERIARKGFGGVLRLAYGGPISPYITRDNPFGQNYINTIVDNSFENDMSAKEYNRAYDIKKNMAKLSSFSLPTTSNYSLGKDARPVSFNLSPESSVTLPITGEQYIDDVLAEQGKVQKAQILSGKDSSLNGFTKPRTTYSKPVNSLNQFSTGILNPKKSNFSMPLSTLSSIASLVSKNNTNNKIFNLLKKKLKPVILDTPQDINYNIQGNEGVRNSYYRQASNLSQLSKLNQTSDADRQLGYNFNVAKAAAEARLQGDLANEQALAQSREKAFQVNASNLARREQVAGQNRASITDMINKKAYLEAQKEAQNAQNKDIFLHDITEQLKQRAGEKQQVNLQDQLLTKQGKDFDLIASENVNELRIQKAMDKLMTEGKTDTPEYNNLRNELFTIQQNRLNRNLEYQKIQNQGMLRRIW